MDKVALAKKIGKAALKLGGLAGADDKVKRLEAEKELLELKLVVAVAALRDVVGTGERIDAVLGIGEADSAVSDHHKAIVEGRETLGIIDRME